MGKNGGQAMHSVVQTTGQKECNPRKQKASDFFFYQEWSSTFVFLFRDISYGVFPEWRMVAFTILSLRSALLENLVQNWHILKWFPYYHLYSGESTNFQKFSTWYEIWVLGGITLCTSFAMRWNPQFWVKSGKLPAAATRCISEELLLSSSGQSGVNKSQWELLLPKCIGPSITKTGNKY